MSNHDALKKGIIDLFALLPQCGDSVTVTNCGDHYEMLERKFNWSVVPEVALTEHDIKCLKAGTIHWH
jgi:hypothetical protein